MDQYPKIAVFVDAINPERRRYCYWIDYFHEKQIPYELLAIPDQRSDVVERQKRNLPRLDDHDIIILNWDVANGDFAWLADETLEYFQNRGRDEIKRWTGNGSRIIIEIQSAAGYPLQELYDALLGNGEVVVSPYRRKPAYEDAERNLHRNERRKTHPIVHDLDRADRIISTKHRKFQHAIFPGFDKSEDSTYARNRDALSFGNFIEWKKDWFPLILRSNRDVLGVQNRPVALTKSIGDKGGEIVATTMRIANSHNHDLIDAFLNVSSSTKIATSTFFVEAEKRRKVIRSLLICALWVLGIAIFVPAVNSAAQATQDFFEMQTCSYLDIAPSVCKESNHSVMTWVRNLKAADTTMVAVIVSLIGLSAKIWKRRETR